MSVDGQPLRVARTHEGLRLVLTDTSLSVRIRRARPGLLRGTVAPGGGAAAIIRAGMFSPCIDFADFHPVRLNSDRVSWVPIVD